MNSLPAHKFHKGITPHYLLTTHMIVCEVIIPTVFPKAYQFTFCITYMSLYVYMLGVSTIQHMEGVHVIIIVVVIYTMVATQRSHM